MVAAIVRLLDSGRIRVGNEAYAQGEQELRRDHLAHPPRQGRGPHREDALQGQERHRARAVDHRRDASAGSSANARTCPARTCSNIVDEDGEAQPVTSTDVNDYIREATGEDFTAKHFRTWSASAIAFEQICAAGEEGVGLKAMLEPVAEALGNTPAISRKSYVHPALIDAVKDGDRASGSPCNVRAHEISVERRTRADRLPRQAQAPEKARRPDR